MTKNHFQSRQLPGPHLRRRSYGPRRVKVGDQMTVTVHEGGSIILTPVRPNISANDAAASAKRLIKKNAVLFKRLS